MHIPVTRVERKYYDNATGEELSIKEDFIESLTHNSFVIQIPELRKRRRNLLEQVLSVFEQPVSEKTPHLLDIYEKNYPPEYREVIRRLIKAGAEPQVRQTMDVEDEIIEELGNLERLIEIQEKSIEEKDKALEDKDRTIENKDTIIEDRDKLILELQLQLGNKQ